MLSTTLLGETQLSSKIRELEKASISQNNDAKYQEIMNELWTAYQDRYGFQEKTNLKRPVLVEVDGEYTVVLLDEKDLKELK
jgi:hypothetical protein